MKHYLVILGFLLFSSLVYSQENKVNIILRDFSVCRDTLNFYMEVNNVSSQTVIIYTPKVEDICLNLMKIKFVNMSNNSVSELFPCDHIIDLEYIVIDEKNGVSLDSNKKLERNFKINVAKITPSLIKGETYKFFLELNLNEVPIKTNLKNVFLSNLKSNDVVFVF